MKKLLWLVCVLSLAPICFAQLTQEQKIQDFTSLIALYNRNYGPYDWNKQVFGFDMLDMQPWLNQIEESRDDLSFYDICTRYVASFHDSHDEFITWGDYDAWLHINADIYDGKVLIDYIDTSYLDPSTYPIHIGDELVSVDGVSVASLITEFAPYSVNGSGNQESINRLAVATITERYQGWNPYAENVKNENAATLRIKSRLTGSISAYKIPWDAFGTPFTSEGPTVNQRASFATRASTHMSKGRTSNAAIPWRVWTGARAARTTHAAKVDMGYAKPLHPLAESLEPFGSYVPVFNPPPGFQLRLGAGATDEFLSGTFTAGNQLIGYIRIPSFDPMNYDNAYQQFQQEMAFFQQNTSGLVVDVMGNGGGDGCYAQQLITYLDPQPFWGLNAQPRPSLQWVTAYSESVTAAEEDGYPQSIIDIYQDFTNDVVRALHQGDRLVPQTLPLCSYVPYGYPATDQDGNYIGYSKPILMLTDNFTLSAAEVFASELQDAGRVTVYGVRTDGGGGNVIEYNATAYSEGFARVTQSLIIRSRKVSTPGFPSAPYIENIGVYPDIFADYQTTANLLTGGQPFVNGFVTEINKMATTGHP